MNISNGGPHLLLFERDQQLASLLISELQLAGYECHTARTAVEVFDAIARFPVRLVLVNLAQAAAARREFWVALDTQRRGRGVQVFTFHCTNIAGYGPQDPDERSQAAMADMEIDGMVGIMSLVDAVRTRIPGLGSTTNTMPRMSKISATPPSAIPKPTPVSPATSSTIYRSSSASDSQAYQPGAYTNAQSAAQQQPAAFTAPSSNVNDIGANPPSYTDRIRAVLYPNQRTWSSPSGLTPVPEVRTDQDVQRSMQGPGKAGTLGATALQRLANGQADIDGAKESGLSQLSRLLQEYRTPGSEDTSSSPPRQVGDTTVYTGTLPPQHAPNSPPFVETSQPMQPSPPMNQVTSNAYAAPYNSTQGASAPSVSPINNAEQRYNNTQVTPASPALPINNIEARLSRVDEHPISTQPLRASPIQDLPESRSTTGQAGLESIKRPEVYARSSYSAQAAVASAQGPSLSSISQPQTQVNAPTSAYVVAASSGESLAQPQNDEFEGRRQRLVAERPEAGLRADSQRASEHTNEEVSPIITMHGVPDTTGIGMIPTAPNNATLIDIMESLPPMPPPQVQPSQATVLNGRATRTLGSVLLAGHLVPESRLEVAQHIQRMLSGVDMNYQLGEILLMFKLLTPDQLLAASLVSYGLITTQQISALGRIRQELHAIGLEYDLENLLILFRILTPEQIREAKANRQI